MHVQHMTKVLVTNLILVLIHLLIKQSSPLCNFWCLQVCFLQLQCQSLCHSRAESLLVPLGTERSPPLQLLNQEKCLL